MKKLLLTVSLVVLWFIGLSQKVSINEMYYLFKDYKYKDLNSMLLNKGFLKINQLMILGCINNSYYLPPDANEVFYSKYVEKDQSLSFEYKIEKIDNNSYIDLIYGINKIGFSFSKQEIYDDKLMDLYESKNENFVVFVSYTFTEVDIIFVSIAL